MKIGYFIALACAVVALIGCQPEHEYVCTTRAALYDKKNDEWTVKYLGPKDIVSRRDPWSNLRVIYEKLAGTSWSTLNDPWTPTSSTPNPVPYNEFKFGFLTIDYYDRLSGFRHQEKIETYIEVQGEGVLFPDEPLQYEWSLVLWVVENAKPEK